MLSICVKLNIIMDICSHNEEIKKAYGNCVEKAHIEALSQLHTF